MPTPQKLAEFKPSGPRVLVKRLDVGEAKVGKVIIPEEAKHYQPVAVEVVHEGEGRMAPNSLERIAPQFIPGDVVLLARWAGIVLTIDDVEHLIVPEQEILGRAVFLPY